MCLTNITQKFTKTDELDETKSGVGYKIIRKNGDTYLSDVWGDSITFQTWKHKEKMFIIGETPWHNLGNKSGSTLPEHIYSEDNRLYKTGFHIYCKLEIVQEILRIYNQMKHICDLNEEKYIAKVQYKNGHTLGIECGMDVIVADDIFYIEIVE